MKKQLKILTLNAGLLDISLFGKHVIEPAPYIRERLLALPKALMRTEADIVGLQEVYKQEHREYIISKLKRKYPYHFYSRQQRIFRLEDSLMFFSKIPLFDKEILTFKDATPEEEFFVYKGALSAKIKIKGFGVITFYNIYTTAGGIGDPQSPIAEEVRARQILRVLKSIQKSRILGPKIILGDLNAGPQVSKSNYEIFQKFKFIDAYSKKHPLSKKITWDPKNSLNLGGPHKNCPPQTIDHIFLRAQDVKNFKINQAKIIFAVPSIKISSHRKITLSDHYGLLVDLKCKK